MEHWGMTDSWVQTRHPAWRGKHAPSRIACNSEAENCAAPSAGGFVNDEIGGSGSPEGPRGCLGPGLQLVLGDGRE